MTAIFSLFARRRLSAALTGAVFLCAAGLAWIGYRAVLEWERAATQVASRRADAAADLLVAALTRDMRGAQRQVLTSADRDGLVVGPGQDLLRPISSALARYPYAEAFFASREAPTADSVLFYARRERRPPWLPADGRPQLVPVVTGRAPEIAARLADRIDGDIVASRRFSVFDLNIADRSYQAVAVLSYADGRRERPAGVFGFLVNLDWARERYYSELATEVAAIEGADHRLEFALFDEGGEPIFGSHFTNAPDLARSRTFQPTFFDPMMIAADPPSDVKLGAWTITASASNDPTIVAVATGARRTLAIAAVMGAVLTVGLWLTLQAGRANARLADMRSDFVSAVTHELKTPIANLRAIHETLISERSTLEISRDYAQMGVRETSRLARLVDNLLAYARITDVADAYSFGSVALADVVHRSLREFAPNLEHAGFAVTVRIPDTLPPLRGDATALNLMLNNIIDNAIRYSPGQRDLAIEAEPRGGTIVIRVTDHGMGIPADDIERVTKKFSRGRGSEAGGSGLGLAIVSRIVADHGGTLAIRSEVGVGTTIEITLPARLT